MGRPTVDNCGENNGRAELTESDACAIRALRAGGWLVCEIAKVYGISQSRVFEVCSGKN